MNPELRDQVKRASENLKIQDIILFECSLVRPERDADKLKGMVTQESKRAVRFFTGESDDGEGVKRILQVLVSLGTRVVPPTVDGSEQNAFFIVEADFLVNYEMKSEIDPECIKAFADNNSVHNVWPFWRQHVFDVVARARLPQLEVPLYSGLQT